MHEEWSCVLKTARQSKDKSCTFRFYLLSCTDLDGCDAAHVRPLCSAHDLAEDHKLWRQRMKHRARVQEHIAAPLVIGTAVCKESMILLCK